jgi:hypothetical protein
VTRFLDVRLSDVGGNLATRIAVNQGTNIHNYQGLDINQLLSDIRGQHVLIGVHGYNVNREDGIAHLSNWETLLQLPTPSIFMGFLWPGDSIWAHGLDYPEEPKIANEAGALMGPFLDAKFANAASISFASHSLGARVVLATISNLTLPVRRTILMAGAIDDNCLQTEFQGAAAKVGTISALASKKDQVLSALFPLGNLIGGIIAEGHPWWHAALGHGGPSNPKPGNFRSPFEIPSNWGYGHHDYLQIDSPPPPTPALPVPTDVPREGAPKPANGVTGWQEAFSAAFCSTRFE